MKLFDKTLCSGWNLLGGLLSLLSGGDTCLCCGRHAVQSPLCRDCQHGRLFHWTGREGRCSCCGRELVCEIGLCTTCRSQPLLTHTDGVLPIHSYRLWKKDLLFSWKTAGMRQLSPVLARLMADFLRQECPELADVPLVPVPPRKGKVRRQGWDQVQELCRYLRSCHGFQVLPLLERQTAEQQKRLDRKSRLENLGRAYCVDRRRISRAGIPKRVILVDDILTTGVTLETCARSLKEAGVEEVHACTLFYVS